MDQFEALVLIAELALGIAGFSGLVVALGTTFGNWPEVDRVRLVGLLSTCVGALFLVLLAMLLVSLQIAEVTVWRLCSFLIAVHGTLILMTLFPQGVRFIRSAGQMKSPYTVFVFLPLGGVMAVNIIVQLANSAGLLDSSPFGVLFGGLVVLLFISIVQFLRLLFVRRNTE